MLTIKRYFSFNLFLINFFVFYFSERTECDRVSHSPAICFQFKIDSDFEASDVSTAELWIYKNSNKNDLNYNQSFVVSELHLSDNNDTLPNVEPIAIQPIGTEGKNSFKIILICNG